MDPSEAAPRRSKRDHQPSAKAAAFSTSETLAQAPVSAPRRVQRRRAPPTAPPALPLPSTGTSSASRPVPIVPFVDPFGPTEPQCRRFRTASYTSGTSGVYQRGVHLTYPSGNPRQNGKVLGRYSSRDCAVLCEVILSQLKTQTLALTVLDEPKSPACIRWGAVAETLKTTHGLWIPPQECQLVWKFLAYGQVAESKAGTELLPDSDAEEFGQSPGQINARLATNRATAAESKLRAGEAGAQDGTKVDKWNALAGDDTAGKSSENRPLKNVHIEAKSTTQRITCEACAQQKDKSTTMRLYPTYSLPTGAPDAWYRPFGPKDALPLTFVASRFLRRKPTPPAAPSRIEQVTKLPGPSATGTAELKRNQADDKVEAAKKAKLVA
ncbi:unnamed protein product [Hyaloperonospora brassicae]|uniref:Uncharacterized protein n=1 Tax=Hyaloperonospora brassicae TaxID=162125 RepID=A0AAV0UH00_HYABA|nr:unnamed protein product [Hyaloperonospora brassicae]